MENAKNTYRAWGIGVGAHEAYALKPMLAPEELVSLLRNKGVRFERIDNASAISILSHHDSFIHIASYRNLFQRYQGGVHDGEFVRLDFADLVYLSELDSKLRDAFLSASQDVERLAKTKLLTSISNRSDEDGYGIVADFMELQGERYRKSIERSLSIRENSDGGGDEYTGSLIHHYRDAMPVWVFLEVATFGTPLSLFLFCSKRWKDTELREEHYVMKGVKAVRNCCSHRSCIINGLNTNRESNHMLSSLVFEWLSEKEIENSKTRRKRLKDKRMQQLLEVLVMLDHLNHDEISSGTQTKLISLSADLRKASERYGDQNSFVSYLRFLSDLIDKTT